MNNDKVCTSEQEDKRKEEAAHFRHVFAEIARPPDGYKPLFKTRMAGYGGPSYQSPFAAD